MKCTIPRSGRLSRVVTSLVACWLTLACCGLLAGCDQPPGLVQALKRLGDRSSEWGSTGGSFDEGVALLSVPPIDKVASYGKAALPGLRRLLLKGTPAERWDAIIALGLIGPEAAEFEGALLDLARKPGTQKVAVLALARVAPGSKPFHELIHARFKAARPPYYIIVALGEALAPDTSKAVLARLLKLIGDRAGPSEVSGDAWARDPKAAVAAEEKNKIADAAAWALGRHGERASAAVSALLPYAETGEREYTLALYRIGTPKARAAVLRLARSKNPDVALPALWALGDVTPVPQAVWPILRAALSRADTEGAVFDAVRELGEAARPLIPDLLKLLTSSDSAFTRSHALDALSYTGALDPKARAAVVARLKDASKDIRAQARYLLDREAQSARGK